MRIAAAICWYDEPLEHLRRVVASVAPLVDRIVAFDGRWESFPPDRYWVPQHDDMAAILGALPIDTLVHAAPRQPWPSQAAKRTALYRAASVDADWVLVIDADEALTADCVSRLRTQLAKIGSRAGADAVKLRVVTPGAHGSGGHDTATAPQGVRYQPRLLRADTSLSVGPHSHRTITTDDAVIQMENEADRALHVSRRAGRIATIHGVSIVNGTHSRSAERIAAKQAYGKARAERGID
jgi:hypothetical protein